MRVVALLLSALVILPTTVSAEPSATDPRPLSAEEKDEFYPVVCINPRSDDYRLCEKIRGANITPLDDGTIDLSLGKISYGSFSKPSADEAYVTYYSTLEGDISPGGGILFERKGNDWRFVELQQGTPMSDCVALRGSGQSRLLCRFFRQWCCGMSDESINVMTGAWDRGRDILAAHESRREPDMDGDDFCAAGEERHILLTSISALERSKEPGILAEATVRYIPPDEINRACKANNPSDAKPIRGRVRFILDGDSVRAQLPRGIEAFSVYGGN